MKLTKKIYTLIFVSALTLGFTSVSFAQENILVEPEVEVSINDFVSAEVAIELGLDGEVKISNDINLEEAVEIITEAEEVADDEIISGDVIMTTDEYIVIETAIGEYVKVPVTLKKGGQRRRTGAFINLSTTQPGHTLTIVPENSSNTQVTGVIFTNDLLTNASGDFSYKVSSSAKVIKNGEEMSQSELYNINEEDQVSVVTDSEGEVIAVTIIESNQIQDMESSTGDDREDKKSPLGWIIGIIALLGVLIFVSRRSK